MSNNPFAKSSSRRVSFDEESLTTKTQNFGPLPEGDYYLKVITHQPKANHDDMDELKFEETETSRWLFDNLVYRDKAKWKIAQILISSGVIDKIEPGMTIDVPDLTGKVVRARVFVDRDNPQRNRIGEYLPPVK